jgi:hypothetical protein
VVVDLPNDLGVVADVQGTIKEAGCMGSLTARVTRFSFTDAKAQAIVDQNVDDYDLQLNADWSEEDLGELNVTIELKGTIKFKGPIGLIKEDIQIHYTGQVHKKLGSRSPFAVIQVVLGEVLPGEVRKGARQEVDRLLKDLRDSIPPLLRAGGVLDRLIDSIQQQLDRLFQ